MHLNYSQLLSSNQLWSVIYLYVNDISIKGKLKSMNYNDELFYLIKKELLLDIQNKYNYLQLKKFFEGKLSYIIPNQNQIYNIIKSLSQNEKNEFINNLNQINIKIALPGSYEIEKEQINNPNNKNEPYIIFKNFELFEKQIGDILIKGKYPCHIIKCSLIPNDTIIFHYPKNKNYMLVVSKIDENNIFKNEYLLIYFSQNYFQIHFNQIKYSLNDYLEKLSFINNNAPIVINGYQEIGIVIKLSGITDDDYFPPNPLNITDVINDFPSKPLIGFENIGATCYMNATLQCLCNIKKFVNYFNYSGKHLEDKVRSDINKEKLCSAFKLLLEKVYPYPLSNNYKFSHNNQIQKNYKMSYAPSNFKVIISKMNPLFEGIAANDAKDLVNFLLMTLHTELNKAPPEILDENVGNIFEEQRNKELMFNKFINNFKQTQKSIISDLFYALNCNITQCSNCRVMSYNYQIYFFLIFPLEEVRKFKLASNNGFNNSFMNNNFNFNNNTNTVDIYDCFNFEMKVNFMAGDNAMYCNYCKQTCPSSMCTNLVTGPEVLIIILNRGKGIEFNVKINFYLELNLYNYIELKDTGTQYELFGVITHLGESGMGGHFIAYCKSFWDNHWFKFNDALVSPVNDFKSEVIDYAMPYLLFYQKKN